VESFLGILGLVALFVAVLGGIAWLGTRIRRRGIGGGLMGPIDEVFHPAAHRYRQEIQAHEQRMMPTAGADGEPNSPDPEKR
jgi:hypothetical protein